MSKGKLIEIIRGVPIAGKTYEEYVEAVAEKLLAEGVIVLPVKVGQKVYTNFAMQGWYFRNNDKPYPAEIVFIGLNNSEKMGGGFINIAYANKGYMLNFDFSDLGKKVFLTREEAEKALAERREQ